jgi:hypothetical protein
MIEAADCEASTADTPRADIIRRWLLGWSERKVRVDAPEAKTAQISIALPVEVEEYLSREAKRLSRETSREWSMAAVVRALWEQEGAA